MKKQLLIGFLLRFALVLILFHNQIFCAIQIGLLSKDGLQYQKTDKPLNLSNLSPAQKIWAHRVNSVKRFKYLKDKFAGFEMDLVYRHDGNFLEVNHPPAESENIRVEDLLRSDTAGHPGLYFDIKNLDTTNAAKIFNLIDQLDKLYGLRQRTIIESRDVNSLKLFTQQGYYTSYYLPDNVCENITDTTNTWAVSQDWSVLQHADSCTAGFNKLTWELSIRNWLDLSLVKSIADRKDVKIVLVNIKSPGYR